MAKPRSPGEVFLALVNDIADGNLAEVPGRYAEQIDVVHPFDPLRGAPLRSRDELRERMEALAARPRQRRRVGNVTIHETTDPRSSSSSSNTREPPPIPESRTRCPPSSSCASATARSSAPATTTTISPRPGPEAGSANSSQPSARRIPPPPGRTRPPRAR
jgi:hypothetical protein